MGLMVHGSARWNLGEDVAQFAGLGPRLIGTSRADVESLGMDP